MRALLNFIWAKRRAVVFYLLLLLGGWLLGDYLKDLAVPEMRPMNEPTIHRIIMTAFLAFVVLAAIPFIPGAEIGFALLLLFGGRIAPLVYFGMVGALILSFTFARLIPTSVLAHALSWLGLRKAATFLEEMGKTEPAHQMETLTRMLPGMLGHRLHRYKHLLLAVALNTPGNSLLGGGGGLAFIAGASRLFPLWQYLLIVVCAVAPVPLLFYLA